MHSSTLSHQEVDIVTEKATASQCVRARFVSVSVHSQDPVEIIGQPCYTNNVLHYSEKQAKTLLNPTGGFLSSFTHSINVYQGCSFGRSTIDGKGCPYCYVREMPIAKFAQFPWGDWVNAKTNAAILLTEELKKHKARGKLDQLRIFMSTATDPYQGMESRLRLTRSVLQVFKEYPVGLLVLQTRSPLIEHDLDILPSLRDFTWISFTIETDDEIVRRALTPTSPSIERRLMTLERLRDAGLRVQAAISPMLPCNPERFAEMLATRCTRALVDTFAGDGLGGKRTEALGVPDSMRKLGYGDWLEKDSHEKLMSALRERLGPDRVVFSQDGFNQF